MKFKIGDKVLYHHGSGHYAPVNAIVVGFTLTRVAIDCLGTTKALKYGEDRRYVTNLAISPGHTP